MSGFDMLTKVREWVRMEEGIWKGSDECCFIWPGMNRM